MLHSKERRSPSIMMWLTGPLWMLPSRKQLRGNSMCSPTKSMIGCRIPTAGTHLSEQVGKPRHTSLHLQHMRERWTTSGVCLLLLIPLWMTPTTLCMRHNSRSSLWSCRSVPWKLHCRTGSSQWFMTPQKHVPPRHPRGHATTPSTPARMPCQEKIVLRLKFEIWVFCNR
jgi:hypothetical protein